MLSKEERKQLNIDFWDQFKSEMRKIRSSNGKKMNWINYPTDVKNIYLRVVTESNRVSLCLDIQFKDQGVQSIVWEQLTELRKVLEAEMEHPTLWEENKVTTEGLNIGRISWTLSDVNYYDKSQWDDIIEFLKQRMIEFDRFYQEFKEILITLVD
ncbi:MAG: DUF4268 domain-containing protein [Bacteroidetes bacterium]|nr:MAG: DUF4268 domain-containing protein [Bacteroidota bacterium]